MSDDAYSDFFVSYLVNYWGIDFRELTDKDDLCKIRVTSNCS